MNIFSTYRKFLSYLIILLVLINLRNSQITNDTITRIEKMLEDQFKKTRLPSYAVGIVNKTDILYKRVFGSKSITTKTLYNLSSITKSMTALCIMQLYEQELLDLDDPIKNYINIDEHFSRIDGVNQVTIRQLLTHTSGICSIEPKGKAFINGDKVGKFSYSNYGYGLLGAIIENITHQSYHDYIKEHLFDKLGMESSSTNYEEITKTGLATPHRNFWGLFKKSKIYRKEIKEDKGFKTPAGYVASNIEDMAKYMQLYLNAKPDSNETDPIISYDSIKQMWNFTVKFRSNGINYGFGFWNETINGKKVFMHSGDTGAFNSFMYIAYDDGIGVIILNNARDTPGLEIHQKVHRNVISMLLEHEEWKYYDIKDEYWWKHFRLDMHQFGILVLGILFLILDIVFLVKKYIFAFNKITSYILVIIFAGNIYMMLYCYLYYKNHNIQWELYEWLYKDYEIIYFMDGSVFGLGAILKIIMFIVGCFRKQERKFKSGDILIPDDMFDKDSKLFEGI